MRRNHLIYFGITFPLLVVLLTHKSANSQILSRYSNGYFALLLVFTLGSTIFFIARKSIVFRLKRLLDKLKEKGLPDRVPSRYYWILIAAIHLVHISLVFCLLPPSSVFSNQPILQVDYAHHYHQVASVVETLSKEGQHWAYDPSFCAGYPLGTVFDVDMKLVEVVTFLLSLLGMGVALAYNITILSHFLFVPTILFWACRAFRFDRGATLLVTISGTLLWHSYPYVLTFNKSGICAFVLAVYWGFLTASLFYRFLQTQRAGAYILFVFSLSVSLLVHILMPFLLAGLMFSLYFHAFRNLSVKVHGLLVLACGIAFASNWWWISTVFEFMQQRVDTPYFASLSLSVVLMNTFRGQEPDIALAVLGLLGFACFFKKDKRIGIMGVSCIIWFFFLAYMLEGIKLLNTLEPTRFKMPLAVVSMVGVSIGIPILYGNYRFRRINFRQALPVVVLALFFFARYLSPTTMFSKEFKNSKQTIAPLTEWIEEFTSKEARIAIMDMSPGFLSGAKIRYFSDRHFIGGPFASINLKHGYATLTAYRFFTKPFGRLTKDDVTHYANLYNIKWIITSTDEGSATFGGFSPSVKLVKQFIIDKQGKSRAPEKVTNAFFHLKRKPGEYPISIFELTQSSDYFLRGAGHAEASLNQIVIRDATPGGVVLKFHWLDTLKTIPPMPLKKYEIDESPVGFIEVDNGGVRDFVIRNSYAKAAATTRSLAQ